MIPTNLKVLTIEEKPFVYVRVLKDHEETCQSDEIPCPHFNATEGGESSQGQGLVLLPWRFSKFRMMIGLLVPTGRKG